MIPVTYRHESENRLYNDGVRWFYGAVWMPIDVEYTINVTRNGMEMMQKEKDEGAEPPEGQSSIINARRYYRVLNARRYYRVLVENDLRSTAEDAA